MISRGTSCKLRARLSPAALKLPSGIASNFCNSNEGKACERTEYWPGKIICNGKNVDNRQKIAKVVENSYRKCDETEFL